MARAASLDTSPARIKALGRALATNGFTGNFETDIGAREVASTDNSIYQLRPDAIAYPRRGEDVNLVVRAAALGGPPVALTARGGNTGTNGQSLNGAVIVDFARHMNNIISIDVEAGRATVEPGVVLDQLNAALEPHGLFFPPMVSTASRATIGGMVATDASGKGSRHYGKTSDYIEALDLVLSDGTDWRAEPMSASQAEAIAAGDSLVADIHREALRVAVAQAKTIAATFPEMNRGLTGYNLQKLYDAKADRFFLGSLLAGSEGTLAITKAITVRVVAKPRCKALAVIRYDAFDPALRDVQRLLLADPLAIEILDDKVLGVAQTDIVWNGIEEVLGRSVRPIAAMNFVELVADDEPALVSRISQLSELLAQPAAGLVDWVVVRDGDLINRLWRLREKSVGLLARLGGRRQGTPFVEDTAVPPERLADFVAEFRDLLDSHHLSYGMFGHADVGCLHVRPFLDMKDPAQAALIRPVSDSVAALTKRYGGLLWGEHGRGFRGEYSPLFFGPELYPELERIKHAFDPHNLFNPGKLAAPLDGSSVDRIDEIALRGEYDRKIAPSYFAEFDRAVSCNGNGACFSWDALDVMCPSYKATRDRAQSPKGRAALLRAWARLSSDPDQADNAERSEVEEALATSLSTCLSCKACTTLCPVNVDIPSMKSRFMSHRFAMRRRPLSHHVLAKMEPLLAAARKAPRLANMTAQSEPIKWLLRHCFGLVDLPAFHLGRRLPPVASGKVIARLTANELARTVVLVEDSFTASFDGAVIESAAAVLRAAGHVVLRARAKPNGKILHVLGLRARFEKIARARMSEFGKLAARGIRLVGLDAATMLMNEQEYAEVGGTAIRIFGLEEILVDHAKSGKLTSARPDPQAYNLLMHCTEQALRPGAAGTWQSIFRLLGVNVSPLRTGCCGMAGIFGHEEKNLALSHRLFDLSWRPQIESGADAVLATGFSCRCQTKRLAGFRPRHPVELLAAHIGL